MLRRVLAVVGLLLLLAAAGLCADVASADPPESRADHHRAGRPAAEPWH